MQRVNALPDDYRCVYKKIQNHMWQFVAGAGYDMMEVHYGLLASFEEGVSEGKSVLEITGEDVAGFVDGLLKSTRTYTQDWRRKLNREIQDKIGKNGR